MLSSRQFSSSLVGKSVLTGLAIIASAVAVWTIISTLGPSAAVAASSHAIYVCSQSGRSFEVTIAPGLTNPVLSPYSGQKTGYPAEMCTWTKDGKVKKEPTYVLLNSFVGKPGPTFCPDCGRLVRPRNPGALEGAAPPPAREEYARGRSRED